MKEERELLERFGKECPFKMPEGYLEQFHERLMSNLPEPEIETASSVASVTFMARVKPWLYMAAMFVSTVFVIQGLMYVQEQRFPADDKTFAEEIYTEEVDYFMSSSLYNEYALYSYLTNGENN